MSMGCYSEVKKVNIIIQPEDVWDYYLENKEHLLEQMDVIAEGDEGIRIFVTAEEEYVEIIGEDDEVEFDSEKITTREECESVVNDFYKHYLYLHTCRGESVTTDFTNKYNEFCDAYDNDFYEDGTERFVDVISDDDFGIAQDKYTSRFWYYEQGENDADEVFEVVSVATLSYNIENDIIDHGDLAITMSELFDCDMCGEEVRPDGELRYHWFKAKDRSFRAK